MLSGVTLSDPTDGLQPCRETLALTGTSKQIQTGGSHPAPPHIPPAQALSHWNSLNMSLSAGMQPEPSPLHGSHLTFPDFLRTIWLFLLAEDPFAASCTLSLIFQIPPWLCLVFI